MGPTVCGLVSGLFLHVPVLNYFGEESHSISIVNIGKGPQVFRIFLMITTAYFSLIFHNARGFCIFRPSPRQSDVMIVAGTLTNKITPAISNCD